MADPKGFLNHGREVAKSRPVEERVKDWNEVYVPGSLLPIISKQASRCMDCGIPFCHNGCPLGNLIPEWNDYAYREDWSAPPPSGCTRPTTSRSSPAGCAPPPASRRACSASTSRRSPSRTSRSRSSTRRGTAVTSRRRPPSACPARPSRSSARARPAWPPPSSSPGPATPSPSTSAPTASAACSATASPSSRWRSGTSTAASSRCARRAPSSAPASRSAATSTATDAAQAVRRRRHRRRRHHRPRPAGPRPRAQGHPPGDGVPAAGQQGAGGRLRRPPITAEGKHVVVIGGGDTGADCVGTAHRQGAASVTQLEIMPRPGEERNPAPALADLPDALQGHLRARGGRRAGLLRLHHPLRGRRGRQRPVAAPRSRSSSSTAS